MTKPKIAIVKASYLAGKNSWCARDILGISDCERVDESIATAENRVIAAKKRLATLKQRKADQEERLRQAEEDGDVIPI